MSSPAGFRYSQADFLARWMPSSSRAGVILSPCPDLAGSLRGASASLEPDDSFASDFAPLAGSADSSCLGLDGSDRSAGGEKVGTDGAVSSEPDGLMASTSEDMPVMMKLEQLRKWQQHMQEQLKAHQLEELLHLQGEQQRLLGMMNGSQHGTEDWQSRETPYSPTINCRGVTLGLRPHQEPSPAQTRERLPGSPDCDVVDDEAEGASSSRAEDQEQSAERSHFQEHDDTLIPSNGEALTEHSSREEGEVSNDRPIKLGICGQKTFEELLEEQMRVEEQRLKSARQPQADGGAEAPPKRAYLKRGEGLLRFTANRKAPPPKAGLKTDTKPNLPPGALCRSRSEPAALQRLAVQRKTASLNKENRPRGLGSPPRDLRGESSAARAAVSGSRQRRNTDGAEAPQGEPDGTRAGPRQPRGPKDAAPAAWVERSGGPNPAAKQAGASREPEKAPPAGGGGVPGESFEVSFQEKLRRWDCDQQLETVELGEFELLEQAAEELSFSSNSSFVMKVLQLDRQHGGLHPRRLSSTPIKSPPRGAVQRCSGPTVPNCSASSDALVAKTRDDAAGGKVCAGDEWDGLRESDASTCGESQEQEVGVKPPLFPSAFHFPARSDPPYDRRSYQDEDEDSCGGPPSDVEPDESTLIEDGDGQRGGVVFDDDDTWNDPEDADSGDCGKGAGIAPPGTALSRKLALSKGVEVNVDEDTDHPPPPPPPPASQLMTRLFPSLKPKAQNAPLLPPPSAPESKRAEETSGQQVQSRQLRERLVELEIEIERFKKENAALAKLRQENEKNREHLRTERSQFERTKAEELAKFEEFKKEENRKLQKERKLFEKHASAARAVPDKKEREEIQALKQQLSSLQEELRGRETRWASSHSRLRQQIDSLSQENGSLRDEIRMLEKLRLSSWQKNPVEAEKDRETKEGPKMCENNASVTKGVKFASPLDSRGGGTISRRISPPQSNAAAASRGGSGGGGQGAAAGMKSSLRRPSATCLSSSSTSSLSSSWPGRKKDERPTPGSESQDKAPNPEPPKFSSLPSEPDGSEDNEPEEVQEAQEVQEVLAHADGKKETLLADGRRLLVFNNGTKKEVSADGLTVKVTFFNGDTKEVTADQRVIYFYAEAKTTHVTYPDGLEVLHFPNNQTEKHFPDGRKEIVFPDQTVKNLFPSGREESVLTDGTVIQVNPDGVKEILFNTGQKEIHTADYKRREYPDGTAKTVYADGRQETRYPNGRLRVKDRDGNVILDNGA